MSQILAQMEKFAGGKANRQLLHSFVLGYKNF
jgi:hypothetical protein